MRSDLTKDVAAGAAIGVAVTIPVPIIGPMAGAAIGAGFGVHKNLTRKGQSTPTIIDHAVVPKDVHAELLKLYDLRQKNIITEAEFEIQKRRFSMPAPKPSITRLEIVVLFQAQHLILLHL